METKLAVKDGNHEGTVTLVPGVSIVLEGLRFVGYVGKKHHLQTYRREFKIGDQAEYGSYNLRYFGPIVSIGAKTVTISANGTGERTRRLKISEFDWRNFDFDLEKVQAENTDTMQRI